ncbi:MAG: T9SS type A sorting domain-containing protein [Bacteroidia bacterium]
MNRLYAILLTTLFVGVSAFEAEAVEKTWTGSSSNSFNAANNWQPAGVPTTSDNIIFNGSVSSANCDFTGLTVVSALHVLPNYIGTIRSTANASGILTVQGEILLEGGTLDIGLSRLKSMQLLHVNGGTLIKGNGGIASMINVIIDAGSFTIANCEVEILGSFNMSSGQFTLGNGPFKINGTYSQTEGQFLKSGGTGLFQSAIPVEVSGGEFNSSFSDLSFKSLNLSGGMFRGNAGLYFTGDFTVAGTSILNKVGGSIYMSAGTKIISSATFSPGSSSLQADEIEINGGIFSFGSGNVIVNGDVTASNAEISKVSGNANISLDHEASFTNCTVTWGDNLLNFGNLSLNDTEIEIGNGSLNVDGNLTQTGNSSFFKTGGFTNLSLSGDVMLNGGSMDLSSCDELHCGNWKQGGGSVVHGNIPVKINGRLQLSNDAVYTATSGITNLLGDFRKVSGTFNHNSGTMLMSGVSSLTYRILGNPTFHILELANTSGLNVKTVEIYGAVNIASELKFNNANAANRPIAINNGTFWLYGNLNISNYRTQLINTGSATIRFASSGNQTILGTSSTAGAGILPKIRVEKPGGQFSLSGNVSFGNGFSHQTADIQFDPDFVFVMSGGSFMVENLFIPMVKVTGEATLTSNLITMGNLEIEDSGLLMNGSMPVSVNSSFINYGRYQNMTGLTNVTGAFENYGEFAANSGSVNALSGINQIAGVFACSNGQVNVLGTLNVIGGTFSTNNGLVQVSGGLLQNGGTIKGNLNAGSMTISQNFIQNSGTYDAQNGTLNIGGTLQMNGIFIRGNGTINFNGIGPQSIPALFYNKLSIAGTGRLITLPQTEIKIGAAIAGFAPHPSNSYISTNSTINYCANGPQEVIGFPYHNLTVSRSGQKTMIGNSSVKQVLSVLNLASLDADGAANNLKMTLLSTQNLTARIAPLSNSASITGNMIVQRWTRGGVRTNRFFASPVDSIGGIKIKQFKDDILVYGPGGAANGFDNATVFNANISVYDEARPNGTEWRSPANINEVVPVGKGVLLYHLGDRTQAPLQNNTIPNPATIDFIGTPNQGTINIPMACSAPCITTDNGNGWNLVANPYASPIDWDSPEWIKSGLANTIFIWNPRINQYASYNSANPEAATNGGSRYIGPGQSFFMKATDNTPVLIANENVKSTVFPDTLLFRISAPQNQLRLVLTNQLEESRDEVILAFNDLSAESFEEEFDALKPKLPMMISNLALRNTDGDLLGVHTLKQPDLAIEDKVFPLSLDAIAGNYQLEANQISSFGSNVDFYLENKLSGSIELLEEGKNYPIIITEGAEAIQSEAYSIRLRNHYTTQTVTEGSLRAFPNPTNGNQVSVWVGDSSKGTMDVFDALGHRVAGGIYSPQGGIVKPEDFRNLAAGVYTITWTTDTERNSTRITLN